MVRFCMKFQMIYMFLTRRPTNLGVPKNNLLATNLGAQLSSRIVRSIMLGKKIPFNTTQHTNTQHTTHNTQHHKSFSSKPGPAECRLYECGM